MKYFYLLFICLILLNFSAKSQAQGPGKRLSLDIWEQSPEEALSVLGTAYGVTFTYMNNDLPDGKISISFQEKTLKEVLDELLPPFQLEHVYHSGQIIIKKSTAEEKAPEKTEQDVPLLEDTLEFAANSKQADVSDTAKIDLLTATADTLAENPVPAANLPGSATDTMSTDTTEVRKEVPTAAVADTTVATDSLRKDHPSPVLIKYIPGDTSASTNTTTFPSNSLGINAGDSIGAGDTIPPIKLERRYFHAGIFYPFSTNGPDAEQYENNLSLHALVSHAGGLDGFECSGLANLTKYNATGLQLAGIMNTVGGNATGIQIAGALNIVDHHSTSLQVAGGANVVKGNHPGLQVTFGTNVVTGDFSGFQIAGAVNVTSGQAKYGQVSTGLNIARKANGPQIALGINIQKDKGNGVQLAGFMNQAGDYNGWQAAGFINKAKKIKGLQTAGFINIAESVKGVQIGFINIADSLDGVPVGLFSLVKKNGYLDLELFYADDFQANAMIKIGAKKFHNIFGFSYETDSTHRWAYGYGFGSQWGKRTFRINTDAIAYYVVEKDFPNGAFRDYELNILSKFRLLASIHSNNLGVFAGPTFNVMVSRHQDPESQETGSTIVSNPIYNHTGYRGTNYKIWVGYNIGIRF